MTQPTFTCRNTLQRLRENYDENQGKEQEPKMMKTVRVEYILRIMGEDGKTLSENKERILYNLDSSDSEHIQQLLEQEVQATEQGPHGESITGSSFVVTNITELKPTGDDDQM